MRLIDADMADVIIIYDKGNELTQVSAIREYIERQREFLDKFQTIDTVPVVRCRECKNYVIVDEFEGGKRYMCLVNHFSYLDNNGDNQFCSYGERKEGADNG